MLSRERIYRLLRFGTVGGLVAGVDFGLVWTLSHWLAPLISVSIAYLTAACCHFLLNKLWVFHCNRTDYARQLLQYGVSVLTCWLTTLGIVQLSLATITSNVLVAKLIAVLPAMFVGFVLLQFFVFSSRKKFTMPVHDLPV
jgi:putative flippase GtrA